MLQAEEAVCKAQSHFDATWKKFQEAIDVLPEEDKGKKLKPIQVSLHTSLVNHSLTQPSHQRAESSHFC